MILMIFFKAICTNKRPFFAKAVFDFDNMIHQSRYMPFKCASLVFLLKFHARAYEKYAINIFIFQV